MRVAGVQMDIAFKEPARNLRNMLDHVATAAAHGAKLVVFPECALPGYCFSSVDEAIPFAETLPGPATAAFADVCRGLNVHVVFGLLERTDDERLFNAAALVGPEGLVGSYRKVHLPYLGVDMFTQYGDRPFAVHPVGDIQLGMLICYDAAFPEASRCLSMLGADLIVLPTNWPPGAECTACNVIPARSIENAVYFMAVNRVGMERGFEFIGRSRITDPFGNTLAESTTLGHEILYADVDPAVSRQKHIIRRPNEHEIDRLADRRPELYAPLVQPHGLKTPRQRHA
jgi:predicted amidohydrolase